LAGRKGLFVHALTGLIVGAVWMHLWPLKVDVDDLVEGTLMTLIGAGFGLFSAIGYWVAAEALFMRLGLLDD
jgi:hypothetical protein